MFIASALLSGDRNAQTAKDRRGIQRSQPSKRQSTDSKGHEKWDGEIPGNAWGVDKNGSPHDGDQGWPGIKDSKPPTRGSSNVPDEVPSNDGSNQGGSGVVGGGTNDSPPSDGSSSSPGGGQISPGAGVPGEAGSVGQNAPTSPPQSTIPRSTGSPISSPSAVQPPAIPTASPLADGAHRPPVNAVEPPTTATEPELGSNETRHSIPTGSAVSPSNTAVAGNDQEGHPSNNVTVIAVTVSLLFLLLVACFVLYRYLRARRTNSQIRWWFHRRPTSSFHDDSRPWSRADTPNGAQDTFSSTLSSMSFSSQNSNPMVQVQPSPASGELHRHLQILSVPSSHRSDRSSVNSAMSQNDLDGSRAANNQSKLHIHPLSHSKSLISPLSPFGARPAEHMLPMPPISHNSALSHSSFASTALSYTDPFSDHVSPSTAFATSPEPLSSVPPSSDWHTTESESSFPNTFSSMGSNGSSIRDPRIIIVSSTEYDDSDSVDYHNTFR